MLLKSPVFVIVGFPDTPAPSTTEIPAPATIVRMAHESIAVRAGMPVPVNASNAARSFARVKTKVPAVVIGLPEIVNPAAGAVAATDVTVPEPPLATGQLRQSHKTPAPEYRKRESTALITNQDILRVGAYVGLTLVPMVSIPCPNSFHVPDVEDVR